MKKTSFDDSGRKSAKFRRCILAITNIVLKIDDDNINNHFHFTPTFVVFFLQPSPGRIYIIHKTYIQYIYKTHSKLFTNYVCSVKHNSHNVFIFYTHNTKHGGYIVLWFNKFRCKRRSTFRLY